MEKVLLYGFVLISPSFNRVKTHYRGTLLCASLDASFLGGTFLKSNNIIIKNIVIF